MISKRTLALAAILAALWLFLSGYFKSLLLQMGVASVLLVVVIASRMDVVDHEGHPYHLRGHRVLQYWGWLLIQIVRANLDVCKRILHPAMPISPVMLRVPASQQTMVGQVIYANSITLTPGTISTDVTDGYIEVHALTRQSASELKAGEMDRRVSALEKS